MSAFLQWAETQQRETWIAAMETERLIRARDARVLRVIMGVLSDDSLHSPHEKSKKPYLSHRQSV